MEDDDDSCRLNNVAKITDFIIVVNLDWDMATCLFQVTQLSQKKKKMEEACRLSVFMCSK